MARRSGRRVEVFEVHTKLRPISVEIRREKTGVFFSEFAGERLENTDIQALRNALRAHVRAHEDATFTFRPYIEYRLIENARPKYQKEKRSVAYAGLEFRVIELSEEAVGTVKARLCRPAKVQLDIEAPQFPFSFVETRRYFPEDGVRLVPYTFERLRVLEELNLAIERLRARLHEFLDVPEDVIGDALDWLHTTRLASRLEPAMSDLPRNVTGES